MTLLHETAAFLGATLVAVPIFRRFGLGAVLGYLAAGVAIGPHGLRLISDLENTMRLAEFGVVLLLFIIGLELQPSRLWSLRRAVFGLGGAQVLVTSALLTAAGLTFGLRLPTAAVAGLGLSLSSTAFALQLLAERNQLTTQHGRAAFGILLFQDLAVIPLLAVLPALGESSGPPASPWRIALISAGLLALVFAGRYVLRPFFRWVASLHSQELFTASTLAVVVGTALLMETIGLSMALGAFLAGVLLADSEYRHELEADIEPFKGLLLGLFFVSVGMSVNLHLVLRQPLLVLGSVLGLVAVKASVLYALGRLNGLNRHSSMGLGAIASQGGEFAFVLFSLAVGARVMDRDLVELLVVVVSLSMAVTPVLFTLQERWVKAHQKQVEAKDYDGSLKDETPVIIAGFGRFGQVVGRVLRAKHIRFTALDASAEHIDFVQKFGNKVYYGDASRLELLHAAQADKARIFVLAIDDMEASLKTAALVKKHFPHLALYARARNRQHTYRLMELGVTHIFRETFPSSLELTGEVLRGLGYSFHESKSVVGRFREHDEALLARTFGIHQDMDKLQELAAKAFTELEEIFNGDVQRDRDKAA